MSVRIPPEVKAEAVRMRVEDRAGGPQIKAALGISLPSIYTIIKDHPLSRTEMFSVRPTKVTWTPVEQIKLERLWPVASWAKLHEAFPNRAKTAIQKQASKQGLYRSRRGSNRIKRYVDPIFLTLRDIRETQKIGREELGYKLGMHRVIISRWELGDSKPSWGTFRRWLEALGCKIEVIGPTDGN